MVSTQGLHQVPQKSMRTRSASTWERETGWPCRSGKQKSINRLDLASNRHVALSGLAGAGVAESASGCAGAGRSLSRNGPTYFRLDILGLVIASCGVRRDASSPQVGRRRGVSADAFAWGSAVGAGWL